MAGIDYLTDPLQYDFMKRALVEVILMGAVTGAIGAYIVLRGLAFIGDALSHAIFPGIVIAFLLGQGIFFGALIFGILTSISIGIVSTSQRVKEDSAIGVLFAGSFALGIVLISSSKNFTRDLASFLFGNVLGVTTHDIVLSAIAGAVVIVLIAVFYRELLITSFDRAGAEAMGLPVLVLDLMLLVLISLTIVVSLRAVGNILVVAMLVTPAATARLLTDRLPVMIGLGALIGVVSGIVGLYVSYYNDVAAGGTIVLVATAAFGLAWLFAPNTGYVTTRVVKRRVAAGGPETTILFESPEIQQPHESA
ncbi:MAG TPA: metal ABC transporter permease [Dehalococcoidia bacterium]|jgi:manganese/iron transport system permease protein|nr:metal ABC transporter permease [Dehalococcoidia bacterium]